MDDLNAAFNTALCTDREQAIRWLIEKYLQHIPGKKVGKYRPTHWKAWRQAAERALGKPLPHGSIVHHVDGDWANNENGNLVICQDMRYHKLLHRRELALREAGNVNLIKCSMCGRYSEKAEIVTYNRPDGAETYYHSACHAAKERARRAGKKIDLRKNPPDVSHNYNPHNQTFLNTVIDMSDFD